MKKLEELAGAGGIYILKDSLKRLTRKEQGRIHGIMCWNCHSVVPVLGQLYQAK